MLKGLRIILSHRFLMSSDVKSSEIASDYGENWVGKAPEKRTCIAGCVASWKHVVQRIKALSEYSDCVRTHFLHAQVAKDHSFSQVFDVK
jgi:hypothetical protein